MYLSVLPSYVIAWFLMLAKLLVELDDLLKPAICMNASAVGAVLNVTVIVLAVVVVENAVVGTPSIVMYTSDTVESKLNSPLVEVVNVTVLDVLSQICLFSNEY